MNKNKKQFAAGMNVGSSSILVTFVLLCLVTFAALSFISARADNELSKQTADRITAYYKADSLAEINLANIDALLSKHASANDEESYFNSINELFKDNSSYEIITKDNDTLIHYQVPVTDIQELSVTLKVVYPLHPTQDTFEIIEWENVSTYTPSDETLVEEKGGLLF